MVGIGMRAGTCRHRILPRGKFKQRKLFARIIFLSPYATLREIRLRIIIIRVLRKEKSEEHFLRDRGRCVRYPDVNCTLRQLITNVLRHAKDRVFLSSFLLYITEKKYLDRNVWCRSDITYSPLLWKCSLIFYSSAKRAYLTRDIISPWIYIRKCIRRSTTCTPLMPHVRDNIFRTDSGFTSRIARTWQTSFKRFSRDDFHRDKIHLFIRMP